MKVARIQVEQQMAQLQVEVQLGILKMDFSCHRANELNSTPDQLEAQTIQPEIQVDLSSFRYRMGIKDTIEFAKDNASRASQIAAQATKTFAQNGDIVGTLPQQGNPISDIARQSMLNSSVMPFQNFPAVPENVVDVTVNPGSVDINKSSGNFEINWEDVVRPTAEFDPPPSVDVYLAQKPRLEFQVVEMEIPPEILGEIDETA